MLRTTLWMMLAVLVPMPVWAQSNADWRAAEKLAAEVDTQPLPKLTGLVVLDSFDAVRAEGWTTPLTAMVDLSRVPRLDAPATRAALETAVGHPFDMAVIQGLRSRIAQHYVDLGQPFMTVSVPRQDATNGIVQILVIESRLGAVRVEGARHFGEQAYLGGVALTSGAPIDARQLDRDIQWLNTNPYRRVTPIAIAGEHPGTTDLVLQVRDRRPFAVSTSVGNTGNPHNGENQVGLSFDWGNAFGRGDSVNARYTTSSDLVINQVGGGYVARVAGRNTVSINGSYSRTRPDSNGSAVGNIGTSSGASVRYAWRRSGLTFGADYRRTDNDVLFGGDTVFTTAAVVSQFTVEHSRASTSRAGATQTYLNLVVSPGGVGPYNTDAVFDEQRAGATARYVYLRAAVGHAVPLPKGLILDLRATAQVSGARLLSSEQIGFGGEGSVRGFDAFSTNRDHGVIVNAEARLPSRRGLFIGERGGANADELSLFAFADYGTGANRDEDADAAPLNLLSVGPGLRYTVTRFLSAQLSYGYALRREGLATANGRRLHVQLIAGY